MTLEEDIETVKRVAGNPKAKGTQQVQHTPDGIHTHDGPQKDCEYCTPPRRESSTNEHSVPLGCSCFGIPGQAGVLDWNSKCRIHTETPHGIPPRIHLGRLVEGDLVTVPYPVDEGLEAAKQFVSNANAYDSVNPPHYRRGPLLRIDIGEQITKGISTVHHTVSCIEVMRHIKDPRLATALRYLWRVAFGGKRDPKETEQGRQKDVEDIEKAIWYLRDWVTNPTTD